MRLFRTTSVAAVLITGAATASPQPDLGYAELYRLTQQFYDTFQYPNNLKEAEKINSTIFSEDCQGRVSDTRNFVGRELNTEYIFGLFTPSDSASVIGQPIGPFEIEQFAANQNIASATTRINFTFPTFSNLTLPVTIGTWMTYNDAKEITQYDVVFKWFANLLQVLLLTVDSDPVAAGQKATTALAASVCKTHSRHCKGENLQYDSEDDCIQFLTKKVRFGQSFELGMNSLLCRNVHEKMVAFRPDVHCPHIGKSGGGQCVDDYTYTQKVTEQYYTNAPWISSASGTSAYGG